MRENDSPDLTEKTPEKKGIRGWFKRLATPPPVDIALLHNKRRRFGRALWLKDNPKAPAMAWWWLLIPQFALCFYNLLPVFVYYTQGVPPFESLEVITGGWRKEGKMGSNKNGLTAPHYFIDTDTGTRRVHCGFPGQQRLCKYFGCSFGGERYTIYYDHYFGVLAYNILDPLHKESTNGCHHMSYDEGVFFYAQPKHTIFKNYGARWRLLIFFLVYCFAVFSSWDAQEARLRDEGSHPKSI